MQEKMLIRGGRPLNGTVKTQGAKNAALPVMAASILLKGQTLTLENVPNLYDIQTMSELLRHLGATVVFADNRMTIDVPETLKWDAPADLVRSMRASSLVLGPLTARCGHAVLPLPGDARQDWWIIQEMARRLGLDWHYAGPHEVFAELAQAIRGFGKSLHIRHVDAGSCNGCESELQALLNPFYNLHRLGIFFTGIDQQ